MALPKSEIYRLRKPGLYENIRSTIQRREVKEQRILEQKAQAKKYDEAIRTAGTLKEVKDFYNQIPSEVRRFVAITPKKIERELKDRSSKIDKEISKAEKERKEDYERYRKYKKDDRDKRADRYQQKVKYWRGYIKGLKEGKSKLKEGKILSLKDVKDYADDKGDNERYEEKERQASRDYRKSIGALRDVSQREWLFDIKPTLEKLRKGEATLSDVEKLPETTIQKLGLSKKIQEAKGTQEYTPEERKKIEAWMSVKKMTPTQETIEKEILPEKKISLKGELQKQIYGKEIDTPISRLIESSRKDYQQSLTKETQRYSKRGYTQDQARILARESLKKGGFTFTKPSAQKVLISNIADKQNKKILNSLKDFASFLLPLKDVRNQLRVVSSEDYEYDPKKTAKQNIQKTYQAYKNILVSAGNILNSLREKASQKISEAQLKKAQKEFAKLKQEIKDNPYSKLYTVSGRTAPELEGVNINKNVKEITQETYLRGLKEEKEKLERNVLSGIPTERAMVATTAVDIGLDFLIPVKAGIDIAGIVGGVLPNTEKIKEATQKFKNKGFSGLKEVSNEAYEKAVNAFTNEQEKEDLKSIKQENNQEIERVKELRNKGEITKESANIYIEDLEQQNKQVEQLEKNLKTNRFITLGVLLGGTAALTRSLGAFRGVKRGFSKLKYKDNPTIFTSSKKASSVANKLNKETSPTKISESAWANIKLSPDDLKYLNKELSKKGYKLGKKGISVDDVVDIDAKYSTSKLPPKFKVETMKNINVGSGDKIKGYKLAYKPQGYINKIDMAITLKDGSRRAFSILGKNDVPLLASRGARGRVPFGDTSVTVVKDPLRYILRYGRNKRVVEGIRGAGSDIMYGAVSRKVRRGGSLSAEEYYLGRKIGDKTYATKKAPKDIPKSATESAEEYWKIGQPSSVTKIRETKPRDFWSSQSMDIGGGVFGKVSRKTKAKFGATRTITEDLKVDTSTLKYILSRHIRNLRRLPKSKRNFNALTRTEKAKLIEKLYGKKIKTKDLTKPSIKSELKMYDIASDTIKAESKGQSSLLLKNSDIKKLSNRDFLELQSAISERVIPKMKYESTIRKVKSKTQRAKSSFKKTASKIRNAIRTAQKVSAALVFQRSPQDVKALSKDLESVKSNLKSSQESLSKLSSDVSSDINSLNKLLDSTSQRTQQAQLIDQKDRLTSLQMNIQNTLTDVASSLNNLPRTTRIPRPPKRPRQIFPRASFPKSKKKIKEKRSKKEFLGYDTFMKPVGSKKYKKVNKFPLSYSNAQDLGAWKADNTLQASFRLRKSSSPARKPISKFPKGYLMDNIDEFRNYRKSKGKKKYSPGLWIEKAKNRLDAPSEVSSIQRKRKSSKKTSKKKNKSDESYWFR